MARTWRGEVRTGFWWRNLKVKSLLERPRRRCDDNVVVYVKKIVLEGMKWIDLAENRDRQWVVVKKVVNFRFP